MRNLLGSMAIIDFFFGLLFFSVGDFYGWTPLSITLTILMALNLCMALRVLEHGVSKN